MGPYGLLIGLFVVTAVFGQLISNTATALIVIPIGVAAAAETGNSILPVLMCVCIAASAALLTPVATPVNLIAMGAAGYKFGDYWKLGLVVMAVFFVVAILVVPIFWPFT
jgi:di/tricarboxylate transporter